LGDLPSAGVCSCRSLALRGSPKRKQVERGAAREAALRTARSQADLSHQVVPPAPQRAQGRTPETGVLRTHGQWTGLFYIRTDSFIFVISSYTDVELTPYGPLLFIPSFHLARGRSSPLLGHKP